MSGSAHLFNRLAENYDEHFAVPHRALYDDLAWEWIRELLPSAPGVVVDAGCGVGRWAPRLVAAGHRVIGIEHAPAMAEEARRRAGSLHGQFDVIEASMADVDLSPESVDAVLALGSLQYLDNPAGVVTRFAGWLRAGGVLAVLVDSQVAMSAEHIRRGDIDRAIEAGSTGRGTWQHAGAGADLHLLSSAGLGEMFHEAGLREIRPHGLLVSATAVGVPALIEMVANDPDGTHRKEHRLSAVPALADLGKQLLVTARKP